MRCAAPSTPLRRGFITVSLDHDDEDCDRLVTEFETFLDRHGTAIESRPTP